MASDMKLMVACPTCKKLVAFSPENRYRPFCTKRCQMLDLGDWADEQHRIPVELEADEDAQYKGSPTKQ